MLHGRRSPSNTHAAHALRPLLAVMNILIDITETFVPRSPLVIICHLVEGRSVQAFQLVKQSRNNGCLTNFERDARNNNETEPDSK